MKQRLVYKFWVLIFLYFCSNLSVSAQENEECTLGVASGKATSDGRPLVWKTRDTSEIDNEVAFITSYRYKFVAVTDAGETTPWMGVNERGFAILNSVSDDLPGGSSGMGNGPLMRYALANFATVAEFIHLLDSTNVTGRQTQSNFGVIDATGGAAIFETSGYQYWKFDANDSTIAPNGYVLRTNFAFNGDAKNGLNDGIYSIERFRRTTKLIGDFYAGDSLNYKSILRTQMRDFSDGNSEPVPVPYPRRWQSDRPYGYIYCYLSICRSTSVSAAVIHGVLPGESAQLSTLWAILGQPASGISVPYWPVGSTPKQANGPATAPLCDIANQIRGLLFDYPENTNYIDSYKLLNGQGGGLWIKTFPAEDSILSKAEMKLSQWRVGNLDIQDMLATETDLAQLALTTLQQAYDGMTTAVTAEHSASPSKQFLLFQNYPNPFNATTTFAFNLSEPALVTLKIFNPIGQEVASLISKLFMPGSHQEVWDASSLSSGTYFYQLQLQPLQNSNDANFSNVKKLILIK